MAQNCAKNAPETYTPKTENPCITHGCLVHGFASPRPSTLTACFNKPYYARDRHQDTQTAFASLRKPTYKHNFRTY